MDQEANQNVIDTTMSRAGTGHGAETARQLVKSGAAKLDEKGNLVATTGQEYRDGMAALSSGDMDTTKQLIVAGQRFNIDRDGVGKGVLVNRDSSENTKSGKGADAQVLGYLGDAGSFVADSVVGAFAIDQVAQKAGMKNGIIKPIIGSAAKSMGFKNPFSSKPNQSTNVDGSKSEQTFNEQSNNSGNHNNSFEGKKFNEGGGRTPAYQEFLDNVSKPKGIVSKMSNFFKSMPKGKAGGVALAVGLGYELFGGTEAEAADIPMPKANPAVAMQNAKRDMALQKPPTPKSGTVLDSAADITGEASLGMSILGLASKTAARVAPITGDVYAAVDTANRAGKGDYLGAAMSAAVGAASNVPVLGSTAALAVAGAQGVTDYMGITGGNNNASLANPAIPSGQGMYSAPTQKEINQMDSSVHMLSPSSSNSTGAMPVAPIQAMVDTSMISASLANALSTLPSSSAVSTGTQSSKVSKGKPFNMSDIPDEHKDLAKKSSNVQSTRVTKMVSEAYGETKDALGNTKDSIIEKFTPASSSSKKEPVNSTTNDGDSKNDPNKDGKVDDKTKQNRPPFNSADCVPNNPETNKVVSKYNATTAKFKDLAKTVAKGGEELGVGLTVDYGLDQATKNAMHNDQPRYANTNTNIITHPSNGRHINDFNISCKCIINTSVVISQKMKTDNHNV